MMSNKVSIPCVTVLFDCKQDHNLPNLPNEHLGDLGDFKLTVYQKTVF